MTCHVSTSSTTDVIQQVIEKFLFDSDVGHDRHLCVVYKAEAEGVDIKSHFKLQALMFE